MSGPLVLCVGDIDVDLLVKVSELPRLDDKVSGRDIALTPGGMSANVAVGLARLGGRVRLVGATGDDSSGEFALAAIAREGVDVRYVVQRRNCPTFMCLVLISPQGEKALIRLETDAYLPRPDEVDSRVFEGVRHVHLTLGSAALTLRCLDLAAAAGASVSLDLEAADLPPDTEVLRAVLARVDLLFLNRRGHEALIERLGTAIVPGPQAIIVTLGPAGSRYQSRDRTFEVAGLSAAVKDTTGAGDCFAAAFLSRHLAGSDPAEALAFANTAAAFSITHLGAQGGLPTLEVVERALAALAAGHGAASTTEY